MDSMSFPSGNPPAIGIIPLGTGNDLSRSLNWGGKYRDKPLRKVLIDIAKADVVSMDRWTLQMQTHADSSSNLQDFSNCEDQLVLLSTQLYHKPSVTTPGSLKGGQKWHCSKSHIQFRVKKFKL